MMLFSKNFKALNGLFLLLTPFMAYSQPLNGNETTELTTGESMNIWINLAKTIGASENAAVLDIYKLKNEGDFDFTDSYIFHDFVAKIKSEILSNNSTDVLNENDNNFEKRSCMQFGYAGACVWTCDKDEARLTPSENKCGKSLLAVMGISAGTNVALVLIGLAGVGGVIGVPVAAGIGYTACLAMC